MLENPVSPTMRLEDTACFAWADGSNATRLQATRDVVVPNSDGLAILKVFDDVTPLVYLFCLSSRGYHVHLNAQVPSPCA